MEEGRGGYKEGTVVGEKEPLFGSCQDEFSPSCAHRSVWNPQGARGREPLAGGGEVGGKKSQDSWGAHSLGSGFGGGGEEEGEVGKREGCWVSGGIPGAKTFSSVRASELRRGSGDAWKRKRVKNS